MIILGIHDGHNCGASLCHDGKIVYSLLEERLTRKKNDVGFPKNSILECIRAYGIKNSDIDYVVYSSRFMHSAKHLQDPGSWYKLSLTDQLNDSKKPKKYQKIIFEQRTNERIKEIKNLINIKKEKIIFYDHHFCHMLSSYYLSSFNKKNKILGITLDGSGDNSSGKIYICQNGKFKKISETSRDASLGKIYSRVTKLLGMKPWEHEYKVMGLAPYANEKYFNKIKKKIFEKLIYVDKKTLSLKKKSLLSMNYCYEFLEKNLAGERFDNISGALQKFTEETIVNLVKEAIEKTKINKVVLGGGVFMNVKANNIISKLNKLRQMFIMPSSGDESLSLGAALHCYYEKTNDKNFSKSYLSDLYLGLNYTKKDEMQAIKNLLTKKNKFKIYKNKLNETAAKLLEQGKVLGRCVGRSEWGARALGNRSILCRPDEYLMVDKINEMVKKRDFWMPFAPSILENHFEKFVKNNNKSKPYFMTQAFETIKNANTSKIIAACHIRDKTIRPQLVNTKNNSLYYDLINKFRKRTNIPVLLNTSFNLHGYPIVETPKDAVKVFLNSGIDALQLGNYLILKK
mgnify:FL=1